MTAAKGGGSRPTLVACSVFRDAIEALQTGGSLELEAHFLDSRLHCRPAKLARALDASIAAGQRGNSRALLAFGECHPFMDRQLAALDATRLRGSNCAAIVLGPVRYRELRRQGAFFVLPEMARRWRELFVQELGLSAETGRDMMQELHTHLLYLDQGHRPVPHAQMGELSAFCGLPWASEPVAPEPLRRALQQALAELAAAPPNPAGEAGRAGATGTEGAER